MSTVNQRTTMPQIDDDTDFAAWLRTKGIDSVSEWESPAKLHPTQLHPSEFNPALFKPADRDKPVIISSDNFIIDGHHRVEDHKMWHTLVPVLRLDQPFGTSLLYKIKPYPGVHFQERATA